ncbi:hypothetical protein BGZ94_002017, partial [Podila epigama]
MEHESHGHVYAKHLQSPSLIQQVCTGKWTQSEQKHVDVVMGKVVNDTEHDIQPSGSLTLVHEQPVFGTIKDMKTLHYVFAPEPEPKSEPVNANMNVNTKQPMESEDSNNNNNTLLKKKTPHLGYLPEDASSTVSAIQNHIKLVILQSSPKSQFDPVERITSIDVQGTIIGMEFLTPDPADQDESAMLAVIFYNTATAGYHLATFHIDMKTVLTGHLAVKVGTSELGTNHTKSVLHIKSLPNLPYSLVYIDRDLPEGEGESNKLSEEDRLPLISACGTPPPSPFVSNTQALYLGSDTGELYRVNINATTRTMYFDLVSGEHPVGKAMQVVARLQTAIGPMTDNNNDQDHLLDETVLSTDFLIYAGEQSDGGVLAIKEEEDRIDLFAIANVPNNSPTLDFCLRESSMPGRDALFRCTGMKSGGAIQRIRSGISVESSGSSGNLFFAGTTGLWGIKTIDTDEVDTFLVVSFVQSTKVMQSGEDGLEDVSETCGLDLTTATVEAGRLRDNVLFQVHRSGVVVANLLTGVTYTMPSNDAIFTLAYRAWDSTLIIGQNAGGKSSLLLVEFGELEAGSDRSPWKVLATKTLNSEPTTLHCWQQEDSDTTSKDKFSFFCAVGTLEPSVIVLHVMENSIHDVYRESLAQAGRDGATIPHSIYVLNNHEQRRRKVLVGLRDGNIISYDWTLVTDTTLSLSEQKSRKMTNPRLFKLGVLPVKFIHSPQQTIGSALILSDRLWQVRFEQVLDVHPVLFDSAVSQACSFLTTDLESHSSSSDTATGYIFIVDHQDMQLVSLDKMEKYNRQVLPLGQ